jgi:hypothetical protein
LDDNFKSLGLTPKNGVGTPNRLNPDFNTKALPDIPDFRHDDKPIRAGRDNKEMVTKFLLSIIEIS